MITTTFGDELKIFNDESKVIGISLKDRGKLYCLGWSCNAYWLGNNGKWITSSFLHVFTTLCSRNQQRNDVRNT